LLGREDVECICGCQTVKLFISYSKNRIYFQSIK